MGTDWTAFWKCTANKSRYAANRTVELLICLIIGATVIMPITPFIDFAEGSAPSTPDTNRVKLYAKPNKLMYQMDDEGTERPLGVGDSTITPDELSTSVAGDGLSGGGGNPLSVNVDNTTIEIVGDTLREKARTRRILLPSTPTYRGDTGAINDASAAVAGMWYPELGGATSTFGMAYMFVPTDYASGGTLYLVGSAESGSGNVVVRIVAEYGAVGESSTQHSAGGSPVTAPASTTRSVLITQALSSLAAGDYVAILIERQSNSVSDTLGSALEIIGVLFEYTADS